MTIRILHTVNPRIFDDTDQKDCLFAPNEDLAEVLLDNFTLMTSGKFSIPASSAESIPFGDVTVVKGYYIQLQPSSTSTLLALATIDVNALGPLPFEPGAAGKPAKTFHEGGPITSISIANLDVALVLEGRFAVWGDLT